MKQQSFYTLHKSTFSFILAILLLFHEISPVFAFNFSDLYEEILTFDENGDFIMCTYDSIAYVPITYKTLGWTLKRKNLPIDDPENTCVTIPLTEAGFQVDPNNPDNKFTYFYASRNLLLARIGEVSQEWLDAVTGAGELIYLDAVMTVCHSGVPQGRLYDNGASFEGEVYNTLEGILGARNWGQQSQLSLGTHFNKSIFCKIPTPSIDIDLEHQYFHHNELGLSVALDTSIYSDKFDVLQGIPTSEELSVTGSATPYGYHLAMELVSGTKFYSVPVSITYELEWEDDDGDSRSTTKTVRQSYTLSRSYSYRKIKELQLYYAESMNIYNSLLPNSAISIPSNYKTDVISRISDDDDDHMIEPEIPHLFIDGGTIYGGSSRPSVPHENFSQEAEDALGEIQVKNDFLSIDGQIILSDTETFTTAPEPSLPEESDVITFSDSPFVISRSFANHTYYSSANVRYRGISIPSAELEATLSVAEVNPVLVHTPVICDASVSDDKWLNQQTQPDLSKPSLILGEPFTVSISCEGTHRSIPGYGSQNYEKYILNRQVLFPFRVEKDGHTYDENTWISIDETAQFSLPVDVNEGNYTISYRTLSENSNSVSSSLRLEAEYANLNQNQYIATDSISVAVVGRLFDFHITDIHDYPRWEGIFSTEEALLYNTNGYYIGHKDKNAVLRPIAERFTLPVVPGSNPLQPKGKTLFLGYTFRFSITTIGNFYDDDDSLEILCSYDYISKKTGERIPVNLYYTATVGNTYTHLVPMKTVFSLDSSARSLSEESYGRQYWLGTDFLPLHLYAVPKGTILPYHSIKSDYFLSDGYICINYHIYAKNGEKQSLDYLNKENASHGFCDMWKQEGFLSQKTGSDGIRYSLKEGDILFYDLDHTAKEDYWFFGTH